MTSRPVRKSCRGTIFGYFRSKSEIKTVRKRCATSQRSDTGKLLPGVVEEILLIISKSLP